MAKTTTRAQRIVYLPFEVDRQLKDEARRRSHELGKQVSISEVAGEYIAKGLANVRREA